MDEIAEVLHDLCQPLTTLRGRLELAQLIGTVEAYREAVELGLLSCVRLVDAVELMREIVCAAKQD
jgi:signal transduction histidine kinase